MPGQRVLVSGMGGELGSLVASMLEAEPWVGALAGIDVDPPRRRLRRAEFHLIAPTDRARIVDVVTAFNPHVVVHLAVWEPDARAGTAQARTFTAEATTAILGAAAECDALEHVVTRSGIEIYGRARGSLTRPTETSPLQPTSAFGAMLLDVERTVHAVAMRVGVTACVLRLAPVLGPHVPSPLGRLLRQPIVPFSALADAPFTVIEDTDAARAFVAAARRRTAQPVNVVGGGAITTLQAILRGRRVPLPLVGPEWMVASRVSHVLGAPVPEHVRELIHRGRLAHDGATESVLGIGPLAATSDVIDRLYRWESVVRVIPQQGVA
jgi:UDP-glucose 4-epimerase